MKFRVIWDKKAIGALDKLELVVARRIITKVRELSENLFSKDIKRLK